jgi:hypothetical protein
MCFRLKVGERVVELSTLLGPRKLTSFFLVIYNTGRCTKSRNSMILNDLLCFGTEFCIT